jgi:hypothetical protein
VCSESNPDEGTIGAGKPGTFGAYYDPVAMAANLQFALQKIGPAGLQKAIAGAYPQLLNSTSQFGATQDTAAAALETALRGVQGYNLIAEQQGTPTKTATDLIGRQALQNAGNAIQTLPYDTDARGGNIYSLLNYSLGNSGALGLPSASQPLNLGGTSVPSFGGTSGGGGGSVASLYDYLGNGGGGSFSLGYGTNSGFDYGGGLGFVPGAGQPDIYSLPGPSSSGGIFSGGLGTLLGGAALAGGLGLLFGGDNTTKSTQTTNLPAPSAAELQLLGINTALVQQQLGAFNAAAGLQAFQNPLVQNFYQQQLGITFDPEKVQQAKSACEERHGIGTAAAAQCYQNLANLAMQQQLQQRNFEQQQQEDARQQRLTGLNQTGDQITQQALQDAQQGTQPLRPDQLANLTGAADLAINSGLSDLSRFRDESLNQIRQNSVVRGLRPGDTPIQNDFHDVGIESQRLADQLVNNVRGQQLQAQLNLPFQESALRTQNLGLASDVASRRQALEESMLESARNARLNLVSGASATGLGLATGLNPTSAFGALTSARTASGSTTATQSGGSQLGQLGPILGGVGGLLTGLNNIGVFK